jgi:uncharacterized protein (TIGR03032 family)
MEDSIDSLPLQVTASSSFAPLLSRHRLSVLVSTYQAGKLIILRAEGDTLNLHFRSFPKAMGVAANAGRMAVGTHYGIQQLYNLPAVCDKLPSELPHDACYILRNSHITGDIDIHEMAWVDDRLWFVNTRFSCLCTLDPEYSFSPQWRPPFLNALTPDDRCHLNGLALREGQPTYITALGMTTDPQGWREHRTNGGILMDIHQNEVVANGLSMPHSPRWYRDRLWLLESGKGTLVQVDERSGRWTEVAQFSGFTRGLDFWQDWAFVGLSQVRQSMIFGGLPLTERLTPEERFCGIQVVNLRTGNIEAALKFESGVQEIFAVQVLPGICFPEILPNDDPLMGTSYALSPESLREVPEDLRRE